MASKKFYLFFLFLFCLVPFALACSPTGPCQGGGYWCVCNYSEGFGYNGSVMYVDSIPDVTLKDSSSQNLYMNNYLLGYNKITLFVNDSTETSIKTITASFNGYQDCETTSVKICVVPKLSAGVPYIQLELTGYAEDSTIYVTSQAENTTGPSYANDTFIILSGDVNSPAYTGVTGSSFIGYLTSWLSSIFPDSDELSTSFKFGFVFVTIFFVSLAIYLFSWKATGSVDKLVHWIVLILDVLLIFYFTAIGYIPIGIIIIFVLFLLAIGYLRLKGGGN